MTNNDWSVEVRLGIESFEYRACDKSRFSKETFAEHMQKITSNPALTERFSRTHKLTQIDVFNRIVDDVSPKEIDAHLEILDCLNILETHPVNTNMISKWKSELLPEDATVAQTAQLKVAVTSALDGFYDSEIEKTNWDEVAQRFEISDADIHFCASIFGIETTINAVRKWSTNLVSADFSQFLQYIKQWDELKDLPVDWAMNLIIEKDSVNI